MNKQEAADFLGVSVRALERYVQQGKISVKYEKGKTRPTANFDPAELEVFKTELNQPSYKPAVESRQTPSNIESRQIATVLQPETDKPVLYSGEIAEFGEITVIDKLASIIEGLLGKTDTQPGVPIADKLLLTLPEAQALTGLSREFLRDAINDRTLKAKMIGRSWRVKRNDLDEYVASLF
jgi:excisionase family DNA binding protein